jgi:hypothetical protein
MRARLVAGWVATACAGALWIGCTGDGLPPEDPAPAEPDPVQPVIQDPGLEQVRNKPVEVELNWFGTACARTHGGQVRCWGPVTDNGGVPHTAVPLAVPGIEDAVGLSIGEWNACVLLATGQAMCWGEQFALEPAVVPGAVDLVEVSMGAVAACGVRADGHVLCWGGVGPVTQVEGEDAQVVGPALMPGFEGAVSVGVGRSHACALLTNGRVRCWGYNDGGQLGDGTQDEDSTLPVHPPADVPGLEGVVELSVGRFHTCALRNDGSAVCWGWTEALGVLLTPTAVADDAVQIYAGFETTAALLTDGTIGGNVAGLPPLKSMVVEQRDRGCGFRASDDALVCWRKSGALDTFYDPATPEFIVTEIVW